MAKLVQIERSRDAFCSSQRDTTLQPFGLRAKTAVRIDLRRTVWPLGAIEHFIEHLNITLPFRFRSSWSIKHFRFLLSRWTRRHGYLCTILPPLPPPPPTYVSKHVNHSKYHFRSFSSDTRETSQAKFRNSKTKTKTLGLTIWHFNNCWEGIKVFRWAQEPLALPLPSSAVLPTYRHQTTNSN